MMTERQTEKKDWEKHLRRVGELDTDRQRILSLASDQAYREILDHPQPTALRHSFAEEDFFFLIHDIGPSDSLELLAMASARQWEYILDVEIWQRDRIDLKSATHWLNLLLKAAPTRFVHWVVEEKYDLIEYYLYNTVDVCIREHDEDISHLDGDFFTFDDVFYIRLIDTPDLRESDPETLEQQQAFLGNMLHRLAMTDHLRYQETILRAGNVLPAESEEEAFRFRNIRLAEKGFLPFDEAVGIYQPVNIKVLKKKEKQIATGKTPDFSSPIPLNLMASLDKDNRFSRALRMIRLDEAFQQIQVEFAGLCNQLASADQRPIHERNELHGIVKKACGYLEIGLERLADKKTGLDDNKTAAFIKSYPLIDIFRLGYAMVVNLRQRAKQWQQQSWFANNWLALSFWDEYLVGIIGGLLVNRPKFYDNSQSEGLYREFSSIEDVKSAYTALKQAMAFDDLFSCMPIDIDRLPEGYFITYKNFLLTLWARHELGLPVHPEPIEVETFKPFYRSLWRRRSQTPQIKKSVKSNFLGWLSEISAFSKEEISNNLGRALENLFDEIISEYGGVSAENLDPRFVHLFMLTAS